MDTTATGWYYALHGERVGPRSLEEVRSLVANGVLDSDSLVWTPGMREWARVGDFSILSPTWVPPQSAPAPRAEAEWAPSDAPSPAAIEARHPWRRFGARITDILVYLMAVSAVAGAVVPDLATRLPTDPTKMDVTVNLLFTLGMGVMVVIFEGLLLHFAGTTPGKSLFGVRVTTAAGGRLSLAQSFSRAVRAWILGMGAGLPILMFLVPIASFMRLKARGRTTWDEQLDLRVDFTDITPGRALVIACFLLLVVMMVGTALNGIAP